MKAWIASDFGHYNEVMHLGETDRPEPEGAEALLKVKAIGINFPDTLAIAGTYQFKPSLPFIPGMEAMGEVVATGPDCPYGPGDRIMTFGGVGAYGEYVIAPPGNTFKVRDSMSDVDAAAFQGTYQTSYFGVKVRADLQPGETLLVHAGAGGVGTAAIQLGKMLGATVIATAGSPEKLEICRRCGADHVINYVTEDFIPVVKELTDGRGADVIYDPVGGDVFDKSTKVINWDGRILIIGFTSGRIPEIRTNRILLKNISIMGLHWGQYQKHDPHLVAEAQEVLYDAYDRKDIAPIIYKEYPLAELPRALDAIASRESYGKLVITV